MANTVENAEKGTAMEPDGKKPVPERRKSKKSKESKKDESFKESNLKKDPNETKNSIGDLEPSVKEKTEHNKIPIESISKESEVSEKTLTFKEQGQTTADTMKSKEKGDTPSKEIKMDGADTNDSIKKEKSPELLEKEKQKGKSKAEEPTSVSVKSKTKDGLEKVKKQSKKKESSSPDQEQPVTIVVGEVDTEKYKIINEFLLVEKENRDYEPKDVQISLSEASNPTSSKTVGHVDTTVLVSEKPEDISKTHKEPKLSTLEKETAEEYPKAGQRKSKTKPNAVEDKSSIKEPKDQTKPEKDPKTKEKTKGDKTRPSSETKEDVITATSEIIVTNIVPEGDIAVEIPININIPLLKSDDPNKDDFETIKITKVQKTIIEPKKPKGLSKDKSPDLAEKVLETDEVAKVIDLIKDPVTEDGQITRKVTSKPEPKDSSKSKSDKHDEDVTVKSKKKSKGKNATTPTTEPTVSVVVEAAVVDKDPSKSIAQLLKDETIDHVHSSEVILTSPDIPKKSDVTIKTEVVIKEPVDSLPTSQKTPECPRYAEQKDEIDKPIKSKTKTPQRKGEKHKETKKEDFETNIAAREIQRPQSTDSPQPSEKDGKVLLQALSQAHSTQTSFTEGSEVTTSEDIIDVVVEVTIKDENPLENQDLEDTVTTIQFSSSPSIERSDISLGEQKKPALDGTAPITTHSKESSPVVGNTRKTVLSQPVEETNVYNLTDEFLKHEKLNRSHVDEIKSHDFAKHAQKPDSGDKILSDSTTDPSDKVVISKKSEDKTESEKETSKKSKKHPKFKKMDLTKISVDLSNPQIPKVETLPKSSVSSVTTIVCPPIDLSGKPSDDSSSSLEVTVSSDSIVSDFEAARIPKIISEKDTDELSDQSSSSVYTYSVSNKKAPQDGSTLGKTDSKVESIKSKLGDKRNYKDDTKPSINIPTDKDLKITTVRAEEELLPRDFDLKQPTDKMSGAFLQPHQFGENSLSTSEIFSLTEDSLSDAGPDVKGSEEQPDSKILSEAESVRVSSQEIVFTATVPEFISADTSSIEAETSQKSIQERSPHTPEQGLPVDKHVKEDVKSTQKGNKKPKSAKSPEKELGTQEPSKRKDVPTKASEFIHEGFSIQEATVLDELNKGPSNLSSTEEIDLSVAAVIKIDESKTDDTKKDPSSAMVHTPGKKSKHVKFSEDGSEEDRHHGQPVEKDELLDRKSESPKRGESLKKDAKDINKSEEKPKSTKEPEGKPISPEIAEKELQPKEPKTKSTKKEVKPSESTEKEIELSKDTEKSSKSKPGDKKPKTPKDGDFQLKSDKNAVAEFISKESVAFLMAYIIFYLFEISIFSCFI
uniref:Uncharacterized protein n=1 Tax=Cacopsylla melanoneura TaxID=428564 RepID=A0A8D8V0F2_9HEMI